MKSYVYNDLDYFNNMLFTCVRSCFLHLCYQQFGWVNRDEKHSSKIPFFHQKQTHQNISLYIFYCKKQLTVMNFYISHRICNCPLQPAQKLSLIMGFHGNSRHMEEYSNIDADFAKELSYASNLNLNLQYLYKLPSWWVGCIFECLIFQSTQPKGKYI